MASVPPITSLDQNYNYPGESLGREVESPGKRSRALYGKKWGEVNSNVGGKTALYEEGAFLLRFIPIYFRSFFDLQENPILNFVSNLFMGSSDGLEGLRDKEMYCKAYGYGVDELETLGVKKEDLLHEDSAISKLGYEDDWIQNEKENQVYGERVISKFGEWALHTSKVKPVAHFISSFLGDAWRNAAQTVLDFPARIWWRLRFFSKSLHSNFVTSMTDLVKSVFTGEFRKKTAELGKKADEYFKNKYGDKHKSQSNVGLGLYFKMLSDRLGEHFSAIKDPKAALKKKCEDGFLTAVTEKERVQDPGKSFARGFVNPDSQDDQHEQMRLAVTDFTGPICAALGLVGTVVFDPLKMIWGICGIEKGGKLINALSASRKSFSLINYMSRFIWDEYNQGKKYKDLEQYMNSENPNKAISELYHARKARYTNALIGGVMAAANIVEPLLYFGQKEESENKGLKRFLFESFLNFNNVFFLRFFSKRREVQGRLNYLHTVAQEKLGQEHIRDYDYLRLGDPDYDSAYSTDRQTTKKQDTLESFIEPVIISFTDAISSIKQACSGEGQSPHLIRQRKVA